MKKILIGMLVAGLACLSVWAANEITAQGYLKVEKGAVKLERAPGTLSITMNGSRYNSKIYSLTTNSWQSMDIGAVLTNGIVWLRNVGGNGSVQVSFDSGATTPLILKTNEWATFRLDKAFTATNIHFLVVQPSTNVISEDFEATILED